MSSLARGIKVISDNNTFAIYGNISSYVAKMTPKQNDEHSATSIKRIMTKYHAIMPHYIKWNELSEKNLLCCIRPDNGQHYIFDLSQKDNTNNDYLITKIGIHHFHDNKYNIYLI